MEAGRDKWRHLSSSNNEQVIHDVFVVGKKSKTLERVNRHGIPEIVYSGALWCIVPGYAPGFVPVFGYRNKRLLEHIRRRSEIG